MSVFVLRDRATDQERPVLARSRREAEFLADINEEVLV